MLVRIICGSYHQALCCKTCHKTNLSGLLLWNWSPVLKPTKSLWNPESTEHLKSVSQFESCNDDSCEGFIQSLWLQINDVQCSFQHYWSGDQTVQSKQQGTARCFTTSAVDLWHSQQLIHQTQVGFIIVYHHSQHGQEAERESTSAGLLTVSEARPRHGFMCSDSQVDARWESEQKTLVSKNIEEIGDEQKKRVECSGAAWAEHQGHCGHRGEGVQGQTEVIYIYIYILQYNTTTRYDLYYRYYVEINHKLWDSYNSLRQVLCIKLDYYFYRQ